MVGIGPILDEIKSISNDKGYITERELSRILARANLPRLLIDAVYDELEEMNIRVLDKDVSELSSSDNTLINVDENQNKSKDTRLQERVQKYVRRKEELQCENGRVIVDEFYQDLSKPRMQYSYFPLTILAFFDRQDLNEQMPMIDMIEYFKMFYDERRKQGLIVEKKASIFAKGTPTDSEIQRIILFNPLGRSCLVKYFHFDKNTNMIQLNHSMYNALVATDVERILVIVKRLIDDYYEKIKRYE